MKSWKDVKFRTAKELLELEANEMEPFDLMVHQLALLEGKSVDDIEDMVPVDIFKNWEDWKFTNTLPKMGKTESFKFEGIEYGMVPLDKITLAQMVDIEEFYKEGLDKNIENIVSILFLPVKSRSRNKIELQPYEFDEARVNVIMEQDMEFVWSNLLFFWTGVKEYMEGLTDYLSQTEGEMKTIVNYNNILMKEMQMVRNQKEGLFKKVKKRLNQIFKRNGVGLD